MVFQDYALYPHMTVYENMAFGLIYRGTPKADIAPRVEAAAEILEHRPPTQAPPAPALGRPAPARRDGPGDRAQP